MAESHFQRVLRARLAEVLVTRQQQIANGDCSSWEHYREEIGVLKGINIALEVAREIEKDEDAS